MLKLGVEMLPYGHLPFEVGLRELALLGYDAVNLWSAKPPLASPANPGDDITKIRSVLSGYGLRPTGLSIYCWPQEEMLKRIEFAAQLGADTVIFHCDMELDYLRDTFIPPLLEAATKNGVKIAIENHVKIKSTDPKALWGRAAQSLQEIKDLVTEIDHPNLGICLAPPHLWVANESISETILYLVERKKLFFYYIWDVNRNYLKDIGGLNFWDSPGPTQIPKSDGVLDHRALLRLLKTLGYDGVVSVKSHGFVGWPVEKVTEEMRKATRYVHECMANL